LLAGLTPRPELPLGPVEPFAEFLERRVRIVNLEELSRRQALEQLEQLLTLVVRPEGELGAHEPAAKQGLVPRKRSRRS